jgi:transcriptional regulator with XRE-family HTH domain
MNDTDDGLSMDLAEEGLRNLTKAERKRSRHYYALAFGRLLRELRALFNLTPAEAAARAGMSRTKWMRRENGRISPRINDVLLIARRFQIEHLWIFKRLIEYREEEERKTSDEAR